MRFAAFLFLGFLLSCDSPQAQNNSLAHRLYNQYPRYRESAITHRRFTPEQLQELILQADSLLEVRLEGSSVEGRPIRSLQYGAGPVRVLLWSQMHGDEATATMALADMFRFLAASGDGFDELRLRIHERLSLRMLPMLNPDGAQRFRRRNAQGFDVNRDALRLQSPEGRLLRRLQEEWEPDWGFNLHDQNRYYGVGEEPKAAALAFLAPAFNEEREVDAGRRAAMQLIGALVRDLDPFVGDHLARYSDAFEPRAFGDNFQKWGTRTILVESGILAGDPEKQQLRRLNFVLLLCALDHIARESWGAVDLADYEAIPFNSGNAFFDLLIREATLTTRTGEQFRADIGYRNRDFDWREDRGTLYRGRISDIGDLSLQYGHTDLDAGELKVELPKVHPRVFRNMEELEGFDRLAALREGYGVFQMRAPPSPEEREVLPYRLVIPRDRALSQVIDVGENPTFFLVAEGDDKVRFYVNGGKLYQLESGLEEVGPGKIR